MNGQFPANSSTTMYIYTQFSQTDKLPSTTILALSKAGSSSFVVWYEHNNHCRRPILTGERERKTRVNKPRLDCMSRLNQVALIQQQQLGMLLTYLLTAPPFPKFVPFITLAWGEPKLGLAEGEIGILFPYINVKRK